MFKTHIYTIVNYLEAMQEKHFELWNFEYFVWLSKTRPHIFAIAKLSWQSMLKEMIAVFHWCDTDM